MAFPFRSFSSDRPITVFDIAATGNRPGVDRIVRLSYIEVATDGSYDSFHEYFNPQCPISPEASAVHNIFDSSVTNDDDFAVHAPSIAPAFVGHHLVGFGIRTFDLPLLEVEFERACVRLDLTGARVIDIEEIYCTLHPRELADAVGTYCGRDQIYNDGGVYQAAKVLDAILAQHPKLPRDAAGHDARFRHGDIAGRFLVVEGQPIFRSGKHKGKRLIDVVSEDFSDIYWLLRRPMLHDARGMIYRAMADARK